jgi:hypothetical protein
MSYLDAIGVVSNALWGKETTYGVPATTIENQFMGKLYAPAGIDPIQLEKISTGIRAKVGSSVELQTFETENTDIVKVVIDDLNIEISVSRSRIENDMINHILTAF